MLLIKINILLIIFEIQSTWCCYSSGASKDSKNFQNQECGIPEIKPKVYLSLATRIIGGYEAIPHSWPFMVSIGYWGPRRTISHACGGALIDSRTIVTAGHCVNENELFGLVGYPDRTKTAYSSLNKMMRIFVGVHDRFKEISSNTTYYADKIIIHPGFNSDTLQNDIAIIKLSKDVIQSKNVNFVCLDTQVSAKTGDFLTAIGWGYTSSKKAVLPTRLMQVQLPVIGRNECKLGYDSQNQFCAGDTLMTRDSCNGDSGSPIIKQVSEKWFLVGVVSYGDQECKGTGVYTNVTVMNDWIKNWI